MTPIEKSERAKQRGLWQRRHRLNVVERQEIYELNQKYGTYTGPKVKGYSPAEYASLKAATEGCADRLSDEIKANERQAERDAWKAALQQAKEIVGRFADGSATPLAVAARDLWHAIDDEQQATP